MGVIRFFIVNEVWLLWYILLEYMSKRCIIKMYIDVVMVVCVSFYRVLFCIYISYLYD